MAANPNYTRYSTDRMTINGSLNDVGTEITYTDNNGTIHSNITLSSLLSSFYSKDVEISISTTINSSNEGVSYDDGNGNNDVDENNNNDEDNIA